MCTLYLRCGVRLQRIEFECNELTGKRGKPSLFILFVGEPGDGYDGKEADLCLNIKQENIRWICVPDRF